MTLDAWMLMPWPLTFDLDLSLPVCADSVTNANTTTTEVSSRGQRGWRRGDDETLDSQRFQRIHPPSVGTFTSEVRTRPQMMTLSYRQTDHPGVSPLRLSTGGGESSGTRAAALACRNMLTAGLMMTGSRVTIEHHDPRTCRRYSQEESAIHTYRMSTVLECEPS
jgi:hypothetical protein